MTQRTHQSILSGAILAIVAVAMTTTTISAQEQKVILVPKGDFPFNQLSLFLGGATETTEDEQDPATGFAIGVEYEYRASETLGIGAALELVKGETDRELVILLPLSIHFFKGFRGVVGPGLEFIRGTSTRNFVARVGLGYEIPLGNRINLAPEVMLDFVEQGDFTVVYGASIGKEF